MEVTILQCLEDWKYKKLYTYITQDISRGSHLACSWSTTVKMIIAELEKINFCYHWLKCLSKDAD